MAYNKEAVAILLDVGPGMCQGIHKTCLQVSLEAIKMILQRKMFSESKDEVSLILFGTTGTANDLASGEGYQNITVARPLALVNWDLIKFVENDVKPENVSADFLDALVVAMDQLMTGVQGKKGFASKRIILFSNVTGEFGDDHLGDITASFKEAKIELNVIGPNLDNDEEDETKNHGEANGDGSKPKTPQQRAGEIMLQHILEAVNGESFSFSEALPALSFIQSREVRSAAWKANLRIGASLEIPVCLYIRIKEAKARSFKNVCARNVDAEIERTRTYHLNDDDETEVDKSDVADGNRYGSTLVPFTADDKEAMKFKTEKCFKVLGFTKSDNVKRHQYMGDATWMCVAEKGDETAVLALSALINALYETNMVAIVRRVHSARGAVKLGCLIPHIKKNKCECLFYTELPFAEDLRQFTFGSLPLTEANTAANKKYTPSDDQLMLMDELIDTMDLSAAKDDEGNSIETMKPKLIFNPHLQRLYQCLQHRALKPSEELPELSPVIANSLKPPQEMVVKSGPIFEKMKQAFKLKPVERKEKDAGANMFTDTGEPEAKKQKPNESSLGGGLPDILKAKVTQVGSTTPVEDFHVLISQDKDHFNEAHTMMQKRIVQLITESFGTQFYQKAIDCVRALRTESIKKGKPKLFNDFLVNELKEKLVEKGRTNFWSEITKGNLGLISKAECDSSSLSTEEVAGFLTTLNVVEAKKVDDEPEDADDLLDELE